MKEEWYYRILLSAEVAEELNLLLADGFQFFHDVISGNPRRSRLA